MRAPTLLTRLWRLQRRLLERAKPCLKAEGIDFKRYFLLAQIERGGRPGQLAQALHLPPPSVSHLLAGLEEAGLIVRRPNPEDRRSTLLELTEAGRRRLGAARGCLEAAGEAALARLNEDEKHALIRLLERLEEEA